MKLLIQACGKGTRLWPLSKEKKPKQFMEINGESFIKRAQNRFDDFLDSKNDIFYSVLENQKGNLEKIFGEINGNQIIFGNKIAKENISNILISLYLMLKKGINKNENIIMTWSDLYFENEEKLKNELKKGINFLDKNPEKIILNGIKPTKASEEFGYIECGKEISENIFSVENFKEKPDKINAKKYIEKGNYFWNGGIFLFKLGYFWEEAEKLCPKLCELIKKSIDENLDYSEIIGTNFDEPIDKLIFEKSKNIVCLKVENSGWNDVGNFEALHFLSEKNKDGNYISKKNKEIIAENSTGNYIKSETKNIILNGINNLVIIEDGDNLIILDKNDSKGVKKLTKKLKENGNILL